MGRPGGAPLSFGGTGFQPVPHRRDACSTIPSIGVGEGLGDWQGLVEPASLPALPKMAVALGEANRGGGAPPRSRTQCRKIVV